MKTRFVYVVTYEYDYEGESVQAVYSSIKAARKHPWGGDGMIIRKCWIDSEKMEEVK